MAIRYEAPQKLTPREATIGRLRALAGDNSAKARAVEDIRRNARSIVASMELIHGDKFKFSIGQDCSFVFVTRVR